MIAARTFLPVQLLGALLLSSLVACAPGTETPDAGEATPDAGDVVADAGDATPDAGPAECTDHCRVDENNEANCACIFNDECGDGYRCEGATGVCTCGTRGTGTYGGECASGNDCASGLCSDNLCSKRCELDSDCPAPFGRCFAFFGACALVND